MCVLSQRSAPNQLADSSNTNKKKLTLPHTRCARWGQGYQLKSGHPWQLHLIRAFLSATLINFTSKKREKTDKSPQLKSSPPIKSPNFFANQDIHLYANQDNPPPPPNPHQRHSFSAQRCCYYNVSSKSLVSQIKKAFTFSSTLRLYQREEAYNYLV